MQAPRRFEADELMCTRKNVDVHRLALGFGMRSCRHL